MLVSMDDLTNTDSPLSVPTANNITSKKFKLKKQIKTRKLPLETKGTNDSGKKHQRILLLGDSHARNCATDLRLNLGHDYEITSFVKPGATMKEITSSASESVKTLGTNDVLIVWGGSNDISRNIETTLKKL